MQVKANALAASTDANNMPETKGTEGLKNDYAERSKTQLIMDSKQRFKHSRARSSMASRNTVTKVGSQVSTRAGVTTSLRKSMDYIDRTSSSKRSRSRLLPLSVKLQQATTTPELPYVASRALSSKKSRSRVAFRNMSPAKMAMAEDYSKLTAGILMRNAKIGHTPKRIKRIKKRLHELLIETNVPLNEKNVNISNMPESQNQIKMSQEGIVDLHVKIQLDSEENAN